MLTEKYRPQKLDQIIGQSEIVERLKEIAKKKERIHMLFYGGPGTGKTTAAHCFARERYGDTWEEHFMELNASNERGIETVRNTIKHYASVVTERVLYLGEADSMTIDAQHALRRMMEISPATIFILSANTYYKIIEPIRSRCARYHFKSIDEATMLRHIIKICTAENIDFSTSEAREALKELVHYSQGDMRTALNTLESAVKEDNSLTTASILMREKISQATPALMKALNGDFDGARKLVEELFSQQGYSAEEVVKELYKSLENVEDRAVRLRLYDKLSQTEHNCKTGSSPIIQFIGFMAFATAAPAMKK